MADSKHVSRPADFQARKRNEARRTRPRCDGCGCCVRNHDADGMSEVSVLCRKCQKVYTP